MTTRPSRRTPVAVGAFLFACSAMVFAACNTDVPTAAQIRDADATSVVQALGLPAGDAIAYTVDEQPVSAAEAKLVKAEDIATINVVGRSAGNRADEVRIVTRKYADLQLDASVADSVRGRIAELVLDSSSRAARMDSVRARVGLRDTTDIVSTALMRDSSRSNVIVRRSGYAQPLMRDSIARVRRMRDSNMSIAAMRDSSAAAIIRNGATSRPVILTCDSACSLELDRNSAGKLPDPLFIIDGVISTAGIGAIDPNRIESIEVVKGNAAARLYGPRAANGVINITTKRPSSLKL